MGKLDFETARPMTYYASLYHDAIYQFKSEGVPFTRKEADYIFRLLMKGPEVFMAGCILSVCPDFWEIFWKMEQATRIQKRENQD